MVAPLVAAPLVAAPLVAAPLVAAPLVAAPLVAAPLVALLLPLGEYWPGLHCAVGSCRQVELVRR